MVAANPVKIKVVRNDTKATLDRRRDGWWLLFKGREEAGPFSTIAEAEEFLDHLDNLQRK